MSCLLTEAIEQEGEADPLGEGNPSFLFRSEVSEVSGFDLTDSNVLLETGGTVVTAGFDWNQGTKTVPLCGALAPELPKRGKDFPTMSVLGAMEEGDSSIGLPGRRRRRRKGPAALPCRRRRKGAGSIDVKEEKTKL